MTTKPSWGLNKLINFGNKLHVSLYRMGRGKFANQIADLPVMLLTTIGRKSGKPHTNPVVYLQDGRDYLVSASSGGMDWHPKWYLNLKRTPEVKIEIGDKTLDVQAVIIDGEERARLYERFKAASSNFEKYKKGTTRKILVIRLIPTGDY